MNPENQNSLRLLPKTYLIHYRENGIFPKKRTAARKTQLEADLAVQKLREQGVKKISLIVRSPMAVFLA